MVLEVLDILKTVPNIYLIDMTHSYIESVKSLSPFFYELFLLCFSFYLFEVRFLPNFLNSHIYQHGILLDIIFAHLTCRC